MTKTAKSLAEIGQGSTKFAIAKVLEKRDSVAKNAHSKINSAVGTWKAIAPKRSGFTAGNIGVVRDKYAGYLVPNEGYRPTLGGKPTAFQLVVNSQNARGPHKGFYAKFKRQIGNDFLTNNK